jgi:hypothetical protein
MSSKSKLLKIAIVLWITWPGLFAAFMSNEPHDFLGYALKHYFLYPPSVDYITNHWLVDGALWKRIFVNAWCINGYILMIAYVSYLLFSDQSKWLEETRKISIFKLLITGAFGIFLSWGFYLGWFFSPDKPLTQKVKAIIFNDVGLVFLFPLIWSGASIFFFAALALLFVVFLKLFNRRGGLK